MRTKGTFRPIAIKAILLAAACIVACPFSGLRARPDENPGSRLYFEGGLLFGKETETVDFDDSPYRLMLEAGWESSLRPVRSIGRLERAGLSYRVMFGKSDIRHVVGPSLTWRLDERWSLRHTAGVVVSGGSGILDPGADIDAALIFNRTVSVCLVYQVVPVKDGSRAENGERIESLYGGVAIHGRAGAAVTLTATAIILILGILYASGGAATGG
ncbi:MAG TPA: hypothetical protein VLA34_11690 [Candidatus Krumholzibacterium sp.]|nr:hypothetical protein [Candidatus Krumholzibacterium sp.]